MEYTINNERCTATEPPTLHELLAMRNLAEVPGVAVAVNESVIARRAWADYRIQANDQVLIITATAGG